MKKVYLAHPISTTGEFNDSIRVAKRIEEVTGVEVYAPALNDEINDKSNNPTPAMIYEQDVDNLLSSDIVVVNYTGGDSDGTVLELGMLAGLYKMLEVIFELDKEALRDNKATRRFIGDVKYDTGIVLSEEQAVCVKRNMANLSLESGLRKLPTVLVYSSNKRALQPQLHHGVASGKLNHMVLGAIDKHFAWCGDEEGMIRALRKLNESEESKELGRKQDAITRALYESIAGDES